jgi:4-hydroxy-2-oxoglutarate aldolase
MNLNGIFPPLTTPFTPAGEVAPEKLRSNVERYNRVPLAGYVATGSTGESVMLSRAETEVVWAAVAEAAAPGKTLIAGTGTDSTAETIDRTRRAAELGYHAALVKTPYYYRPQMTEAALEAHFRRVADASPIPLLIYSVPQFTGLAVEPELVARLAEHPNIAGIKESSGHVERVSRIIAGTPARFSTLVGSATTLFPSIAMGAVGGILALACVLPEACAELHRLATAGDTARAKVLQQRLLAPTKVIVASHGVPGIKYAMDRTGYYGGPARGAFLPLGDAARKEVDAVLAGAATAAAD